MTETYTNAYVLRPGFDLSAIKKHIRGKIIYLTDGYSLQSERVMEEIVAGTNSFQSRDDVILPVGNTAMNCFMISCILTKPSSLGFVTLALWRNSDYDFVRVGRGSFEILE